MKINKIFALIIAALILCTFTLTACGGGTEQPKDEGTKTDQGTTDPGTTDPGTTDPGTAEEEDELTVEGLSSNVKLNVGDVIPDLKFKLHPVSEGQETSLYQIMEERDATALVLDFWAVWCEPCKEELPYLETMYREYQDKGLVVLAATIDPYDAEVAIFESLDNSEGTPNDNKIKKSWKKLGEFKAIDGNIITMPVPVDGEREMAKALGVTSIPRTFLIDKDHKLFYQHTGFDEGKVNELKEKVMELMGL